MGPTGTRLHHPKQCLHFLRNAFVICVVEAVYLRCLHSGMLQISCAVPQVTGRPLMTLHNTRHPSSMSTLGKAEVRLRCRHRSHQALGRSTCSSPRGWRADTGEADQKSILQSSIPLSLVSRENKRARSGDAIATLRRCKDWGISRQWRQHSHSTCAQSLLGTLSSRALFKIDQVCHTAF